MIQSRARALADSLKAKAAGPGGADAPCNVGKVERVISAIAGTAMVAEGLRRRSLRGIILAVGGAGLLYRGASGNCLAYRGLGISTVGGTLETLRRLATRTNRHEEMETDAVESDEPRARPRKLHTADRSRPAVMAGTAGSDHEIR